MKILIVCGGGIIGGKEVMSLELARGLQTNSLDVHLLTSTWGTTDFQQRLAEGGIQFDLLPLGFISSTLTLQCLSWTYGQIERWSELVRGYKSLLQKIRPSKIIHTNWQ